MSGVPVRMAVVGPGGAGKSTLAVRLGAALGLPVVDLDHALAGVDGGERRTAIVAALVAEPRWILDGDHAPSQSMRFAAADLVVFLDVATPVCLWRMLRRAVRNRGARRGRATATRPLGGRWRTAVWLLRYRRRHRPLLLRNLAEHGAGRDIRIVRTDREVEALVRALVRSAERGVGGTA